MQGETTRRTLSLRMTRFSASRTCHLAMKMYPSSSGSGKVGFTVVGDPNDPQPEFIGGVRGEVDRDACFAMNRSGYQRQHTIR